MTISPGLNTTAAGGTTTENNSPALPAVIKKRTWSSIISKDLIANISTFLILGDVWNLIQTTSSKEEDQEIKRAYLKHNFKFLWYYIKILVGSSPHLVVQLRLSSWMEINSDWKQMYDNPEEHGILTASDKQYFDDTFNNICGAIDCCNKEIVTYLIEHRDVDINDGPGSKLPLYKAIHHSDLSMLEFVLSIENIDVNKYVGVLAILHYAMAYKEITPEKLNLLLSHPNINVNIRDNYGRTALHVLCMSSNRLGPSSIWKARMLIDYGVDTNLGNVNGRTALQVLQIMRCRESLVHMKETLISLLRRVSVGGRMTRSITG